MSYALNIILIIIINILITKIVQINGISQICYFSINRLDQIKVNI